MPIFDFRSFINRKEHKGKNTQRAKRKKTKLENKIFFKMSLELKK